MHTITDWIAMLAVFSPVMLIIVLLALPLFIKIGADPNRD